MGGGGNRRHHERHDAEDEPRHRTRLAPAGRPGSGPDQSGVEELAVGTRLPGVGADAGAVAA
jgi:hypothetical protein